MRLHTVLLLITFLLSIVVKANYQDYYHGNFNKKDSLWVDSVFNTMNDLEKIGQLFTVRINSNANKSEIEEITRLIKTYNIGGLVFFKGTPYKEARLTNYFQSITKVPLLISIDGEWGLGMRLDSTISFPKQMTLGAIENDSLIYDIGKEVAREFRRLGIHQNFAPVLDINNNPLNPVINIRSFGESKYKVAQKGIAFMKGMEDNGLQTIAKHFPGHGNTICDSHKELPLINVSCTELDTMELYPFKEIIKNNIKGIMVGHLSVPALDSTKELASTLSYKIVTETLKNKLGFKGLIYTDALDMGAITKFFRKGEAEVKALKAGNDILLLSENVPQAVNAITYAIDSCSLDPDLISQKCKKILFTKKLVGIDQICPVDMNNLEKDLNSKEAELLNIKSYENALTLLQNKNNIIPLKRLDTLKIAAISIGDINPDIFQKSLNYYAPIDYYNLSKKFGKKELDSTISKLSTYNLIIIGINKMTSKAGSNFGVSDETNDLIDSLLIRNNIILTVFGIPYILSDIRNINKATGIIISYQDNKYTQSLSAQLIFGGIKSKGKLPVSINQFYKINDGLSSSEPSRLKYYIPEGLNISSETLSAIDTIALKGIAKKAFPGCQILVVYKGSVIYYKSFGNHTYDKKHPVLNDDIYDLASVTKTAATTLAVMKLYDDGLINLDRPLSDYLPILKNSNKENLIIRDIMTHQARLMPWIPFYKKTILKNKYIDGIYSKIQSDSFPFKVADSLFIRKDYRDTIINEIIKSPLNKKAHYLYSDLGFYLLREAIEKITGMKFEEYLNKTFYKPLGLSTMCFQPYKYYAKDRIPPTENDKEFRNQLIHSTVHDQGAAMLGGISGHAGLFSDANDLAILMEMLLKKGTYGGIKYIKEETVNEFTKYQFPNKNNRRALGFDKPILKNVKGGPACKNASQLSFGHTGFTGTMFWVDPRYELVYVFLSNRVYPDANNTKLADMNIRTDIQQIIYNAILPTNMNNK